MNKAINEIKNTLDGTNSRIDGGIYRAHGSEE